jgi:hypothetical protein
MVKREKKNRYIKYNSSIINKWLNAQFLVIFHTNRSNKNFIVNK